MNFNNKGVSVNIDYVLRNFDYNPATGELFRVLIGGERVESGTPANGYLRSKVDRKLEYNHRVAWCHYYRESPPEFIDHINRVRTDNSIKNLRACTLSQNQSNRKVSSNNTSGFTGVSFMKSRGKYKATIYKNSKPIYLGLYDTAELASEAYKKSQAVYHEMD